MAMEMTPAMNYLWMGLALTLLMGGVALLMAFTARRQLRYLQAQLTVLQSLRGQDQGRMDARNQLLNELNVRLARLEGGSSHHGFKEAIALSQHGASVEQISESCGLSQGEAQLVRALHGTN